MTDRLVLKGQTLTFTDDPFRVGPEAAVAHQSDGAVWIEDGLIRAVGPAEEVLERAHTASVVDYGDCLIAAGFIDCHAHYPQLSMVASYGAQLLDWLEKYTFPTESAFADADHARAAAGFFLDQCLRNGITTSSVYATVHPGSVDAFFEAASARGLRMGCGKVLMDRNAPDALRDTAQTGYDQSKALIERWHGIGRNIYAITPRFAPTSSPAQLEAAGALWKEYPDTLMQTHLSENPKEVAWVAELFPEAPDYFGVCEEFGLAGPGAIFGHAIHLTARERAAIRDTGSAIAHCPTSNTFMGSGLFDMEGLRDCARPVAVGLATDVAGGTSLSMFATMRAAYEIAQLRGYSLHPAKAWYLASAGSAGAMRLDGRVGNLAAGMEADIVVIDLASTPLIARRMAGADSLWDALFAQIILADDRAIRATYAAGRLVFQGNTKDQ
ncbi:MAG: guanine deaminase [Proteobacteria bacterium]|nr:guanine deaminase [Pseudomonadota bacterium]